MKKPLSCFTCAVLCLCFVFSVSAAMLGDVTGDAAITAVDARRALRAAVGLETLQGEANHAADITMDGAVTAADARVLLRIAVGLEITDGKYYADQFEVLRSGWFYSKADFGSGIIRSAEVAGANRRSYFSIRTAPGSVVPSFSALIKDVDLNPTVYTDSTAFTNAFYSSTFYMLNRDTKQYADVSDEMREILKQNPTLLPTLIFSATQSGLPASVTSLSQANSVRNADFEGTACKAYDFRTDNGRLRYYMDGKRLLGVDTLNLFGIRTSRGVYETVSPCVPAELLRIPADYTETDGDALILSMASGTAWETLLKK